MRLAEHALEHVLLHFVRDRFGRFILQQLIFICLWRGAGQHDLIERRRRRVEIIQNSRQPLETEKAPGDFGMDRIGAGSLDERQPKFRFDIFSQAAPGHGRQLLEQICFGAFQAVVDRHGPFDGARGQDGEGLFPQIEGSGLGAGSGSAGLYRGLK